jgi:hypothetical protein
MSTAFQIVSVQRPTKPAKPRLSSCEGKKGVNPQAGHCYFPQCRCRHPIHNCQHLREHKGGHPMSDENRLDEAAAKAVRAQQLLDNDLLREAFAELEQNYTAAWRATTIDDVGGREKLFLAINVVGKVRDHLGAIIANGKLAQAELKELSQVAERRKRFGIV